MTQPLVSVIIPCRNGATTLHETLTSVIDQSWPAVEIIVVENNSADDSAEVARATLARHKGPWQVIVSAAQDQNAAREAGFAQCSGHYVQWLDADDTFGPDKTERQVLALESSPEYDIAHGDWVWEQAVPNLRAPAGAKLDFPMYAIAYGARDWRRCQRREHVVSCTIVTGPSTDYLLRLLADWWAPQHAYLVRRRAAEWLQEHRAWNPHMPCATDREYFTTAALHGFRFLHVPGAHTIYSTRPGSAQMTLRIRPPERAQALAGMQQRLSTVPRCIEAPPLGDDHRFLLGQDRRLWSPPRGPDLLAASSARPDMRILHELYARIMYPDTLEQHAKIIAWHAPGWWEQHVTILRELHRLGEIGAISPVIELAGNIP